MSAPDTNTEKQAKSHVAPIWGIGLAVFVGLVLAVAMVFSATDGETDTDDAAIQSGTESLD
ncbi:hypothetical protein [Pseudooceanicola sp. HF7]|uniref:hypothetical protein n=1 Tax=Pseudooceanicola sp. HF7 TaxID=2721560 RepID=UPI0014322DB0|nr:hypothetical protein [Pseudooceanicola sp. HF7]NIZ09171.1 hypothetical protein [Pseudooceanicola sp. HF7]